jgi:hypothetical protein
MEGTIMKALLGCGLALIVGLWISRSDAEEIQWRSGAAPSAAAVSPSPAGPAPASGENRRLITLARPVPLNPAGDGSAGPTGTGVQPVLARPGQTQPTPLVRAKNDDEARPLPPGPSQNPPKGPALKSDQKSEPIAEEILFQPARPQLIQVPKSQPAPLPKGNEEVIPKQPRLVPQPYEVHPSPGQAIPEGGVPGSLLWEGEEGTFMDGCGSDSACLEDGCFDGCSNRCGKRRRSCFGCDVGGTCCYPRGKCWASAEYLLYGFKTPNLPPLVTSSLGLPNQGALNQPTTQVLYGDGNFNDPTYHGGRVSFGFWCPRWDCWGVDASFFFLGPNSSNFSVASAGSPILARPFIDANNNQEAVQPVATPNILLNGVPSQIDGRVSVDYRSSLWGLDLNLRRKLWCGPDFHVDLLLGYRHLQLNESLIINENLQQSPPAGLGVLVTDRFFTRNYFNGGQIGFDGEYRFHQRWFIGGQVKVAAGPMHQIININGNTTFISPNGASSVTFPSGVFATTTNSGRYTRDKVAIMPEANVKLGYNITDQLRIFVGYNFLYINNVVRPGDAYDRTVNPTQLPSVIVLPNGTLVGSSGSLQGPARPSVFFRGESFWAQGFNAGLEYRY